MKNLILGAFFTLSFYTVYGQSGPKTSAQEVATPELAKKREASKKAVVSGYLSLKQDLVVSDSLKASKSAAELSGALSLFKFKKLGLVEMNSATSMRGKLILLANKIADTHSINKQREHMAELSEGMWTIIEKLAPENTVLYEQRCPMANKVWISDEKEIKNPYFPKNMLDCGAVIASVGAVQP